MLITLDFEESKMLSIGISCSTDSTVGGRGSGCIPWSNATSIQLLESCISLEKEDRQGLQKLAAVVSPDRRCLVF